MTYGFETEQSQHNNLILSDKLADLTRNNFARHIIPPPPYSLGGVTQQYFVAFLFQVT